MISWDIPRHYYLSAWDAGYSNSLWRRLRDKDEDYWNIYKGTPKEFISNNMGKNCGEIFRIRLPQSDFLLIWIHQYFCLTSYGSLDPQKMGFTISPVRYENLSAASEGVDFVHFSWV
jgi:hypothetical protein